MLLHKALGIDIHSYCSNEIAFSKEGVALGISVAMIVTLITIEP